MRKEERNHSVALLCWVLKVSRSGYYRWQSADKKRDKAQKAEEHLCRQLKAIHSESRQVYGRRRVFAVCKKQDVVCSKRRTGKLMRKIGICGLQKRRFKATTKANNAHLPSPNLILQDFKVFAPNVLWTSDITYIRTYEGWVYLCIILDVFARRVVCWSMQKTMKAELVQDAIDHALVARKPPAGVIFHSDRGSQYTSNKVKTKLKSNSFHQSMSDKDHCYDNAITETFFATLKKELVYRMKYTTREGARAAIFEYLEVFYNRLRVHSALGYVSPVEFEGPRFI